MNLSPPGREGTLFFVPGQFWLTFPEKVGTIIITMGKRRIPQWMLAVVAIYPVEVALDPHS
jgi:hypothetical protein